MANYATSADLYRIFGQELVKRWADPNNESDEASIDDRIDWALEEATQEVNERLVSRYAVPFSSPYPRTIITVTALQAGIYLFNIRRTTDTDASAVTAHEKWVKRMFRQILAGQRDLLDPSTNEIIEKYAESAPFVVND